MEELVLADGVRSGKLLSLVTDPSGRVWQIDISSSAGYPPKYTARVDRKQVPGGPFAEKDLAHSAAMTYIEHRSGAADKK